MKKRDPLLQQRLQEFLDQGVRITPLDCMLGIMKVRIEEGNYDGALTAAEKAAPYCHPKLAMTDLRDLLNLAIFRRDIPVLQATILVLATFFVVLNLLVDIAQAAIDPRIRR